MEILQAARRSPSWANRQVWRFIVVKDQKIKEQLNETLPPTNPARLASAFVDAPVVICIAAQRWISGYGRGEARTDKGDWFMLDVGIAMEHIVLTAWNFGLGTVPSVLRCKKSRSYPENPRIQYCRDDTAGVF